MVRKIGAHLSIAGGHKNALNSIFEKGGNCLQIFSSSPRGWNKASIDEKSASEFVDLKKKLNIVPIYFHASYLINLADPGETGKKSIDILINELNLANQLNITGSIVHTGSFKSKVENLVCHEQENYPQLLANIKNVLNNSPANTYLILENAGTRKIGQTIDQLAEIIRDVNNPRLRVCLDTCHLHAAGYDIGDGIKLDKFLDNFDTKIGLDKLEVFHLNDSKDNFGSLRDRHENIGEGKVGIDVFNNLLNNPRTKSKSFIIETPGFDKKGPDKKNLDILRELSR